MLIKNKGFSLVEVIVASLIFALASSGVYHALIVAQKASTVSEKEVIAANYGRQLLEDLRAKVDQRSWEAGSWYLSCDGAWHDWPVNPAGWDAFTGSADYKCDQDIAAGSRKVTLNVIW